MAKQNINQKGTDLDAALQEGFFQKNLKKIVICCGIVVALVIAGILCHMWMKQRAEKAAEALFPCEQYFQQGNYEKALNGDGQECAGFLAVADQYGCTKSGNLAKLYAGLSYAQLGKFEDAQKYLDDFSSKGDEMVSPAALGALGNVKAELGQNEEAAETLLKAAKKADNNVLSPLYLIQAGEIYESLGQKDKALELYEQVKDNYRGSMLAGEIDKYIERAKRAK